jgi:acyl-CoA dehydrogenase
MDFILSADDKAFKAYCQEFTRKKILPISAKYGETSEMPSELVQAMAEADFFKLLLPEDLGGQGIKAIKICLAREILAGAYCPADVLLAMQGLGSYPLFIAGDDSQQQKYLLKIGKGQLLTTYALTEPEAGSDVNSIQSTAKETAGGFILNGKKRFISNGNAADILVTFVKTPLPDNPNALSAFIVEKGFAGFAITKKLEVIAPHDLVELEFDNCFVPADNLLGKLGDGFKIAMQTLQVFRMSVGAAAIGIGQTAFDAALDHAQKRIQFSRPIANFQGIQMRLAEMATDLDAARGLVYRAATLSDRNDADITRAASMAKLFATEAAFRVIDQSLQIHGGSGVIKGSAVERLYREIRALRIYEGTSEIHKLIIAKSFLKDS